MNRTIRFVWFIVLAASVGGFLRACSSDAARRLDRHRVSLKQVPCDQFPTLKDDGQPCWVAE